MLKRSASVYGSSGSVKEKSRGVAQLPLAWRGGWDGLHCAHRATTIHLILPSLLAISPRKETNCLPLRATNEHLLIFQLLHRGQATSPSLRASSDHRFIVGALRAQRLASLLAFPFQARSYFSSKGGLVDPQLRVSNEHIPIVRVPRAKRTTRLPIPALRFPQSSP